MLSLCAIEPHTLELLRLLNSQEILAKTRLVGGTALALQYGHRKSVDLDFFSCERMDFDEIIAMLRTVGEYRVLNKTKNILQVVLDGVKVDFVNYDCYPWIDDVVVDEGIRMASPKDIGAMKINAIIGRGTRKDFVDLYVLLQHYPLSEVMSFYHRRYPDYSEYRALLSLSYFKDAESQDMPAMNIPDSWEKMKAAIATAIDEYQK